MIHEIRGSSVGRSDDELERVEAGVIEYRFTSGGICRDFACLAYLENEQRN